MLERVELDEVKLAAMLDGLEDAAFRAWTTTGAEAVTAEHHRRMFRDVIRRAILEALTCNPHLRAIAPTAPLTVVEAPEEGRRAA